MSALWQVAILETHDTHLRLQLRFSHPDAGDFPNTPSFALRLLHEQAWEFDSNLQYKGICPLGESITQDNIYDDDWLAEHTDQFITSVQIEQVKGESYDEKAVIASINQVLDDTGMSRGSSEREREFNELWGGFWKTSAVLPVATYKITVSDPKWISHMTKGKKWNSAAFE